jgi:hypothetical protein
MNGRNKEDFVPSSGIGALGDIVREDSVGGTTTVTLIAEGEAVGAGTAEGQ